MDGQINGRDGEDEEEIFLFEAVYKDRVTFSL